MFLFLDTETTGLPTRWGAPHTDLAVWPRIVSVSWSIYRTKSERLKLHHSIVQPAGFSIPDGASRVHGITNELAHREGLPLAGVLAALLHDIRELQPSCLVCHNVDFDRPVLLAELLRSGLDPQAISPFESLPTYCTMKLTTDFCAIPGGPRGPKFPKLEELYYKLFARSLSGTHNSANDTQACAECFFQFIEISGGSLSATTASLVPAALDDDSSGEAQELLDQIYEFAAVHPTFDTDFIDSVQSQLDDRGFLTPNQIAALQKIITRWHIS